MSLVSETYAQTSGKESGLGENLGFSFGLGFAFPFLSDGKEYAGKSTFLGGGRGNRFIQAMKGGSLQPLGFASSTAETMRLENVMGKSQHTTSFLGWRNMRADLIKHSLQPGVGPAVTKGAGFFKNAGSLMKFGKAAGVGLGRLAGPLAFAAFAGVAAYEGYKRGGRAGAAVAVAGEAASFGAMAVGSTLATSVLGSAALPVGLLVGAGYAEYQMGKQILQAGQEKVRGMRKLEMVAPVADPYGIGATMRQRSITAIQNSYINGRMAMGNEALLMATPYLR